MHPRLNIPYILFRVNMSGTCPNTSRTQGVHELLWVKRVSLHSGGWSRVQIMWIFRKHYFSSGKRHYTFLFRMWIRMSFFILVVPIFMHSLSIIIGLFFINLSNLIYQLELIKLNCNFIDINLKVNFNWMLMCLRCNVSYFLLIEVGIPV